MNFSISTFLKNGGVVALSNGTNGFRIEGIVIKTKLTKKVSFYTDKGGRNFIPVDKGDIEQLITGSLNAGYRITANCETTNDFYKMLCNLR